MKLSTTSILAILAITTAAAPGVSNSTLQKRASWSITPFPGRDTCTGSASAFRGTGTQGCTNIGSGASSANIIVSDTCTITRWASDNCVDPLGPIGPGNSACFTGQVMRGFNVRC